MRNGLAILMVLFALASYSTRADWPAARGNAQRTGNVDGQPGPKTGKVLWTYESADNYISTGSPGNKTLFVPALGTLNSGVISALSTEQGAAKRLIWSKSQPSLKLPTVCAPAIVGGKIYFGDGMHQNESPTMYCLDAATGASVWQLPIPGALIHLEGTPTVLDGKAFFGAGNGGVMCLDVNKLILDGKEVDAAAVAASNAKLWKDLQAKYEEDKKKDPDFAIPPSEDTLPKPAPKLLWQQGAGAKPWHVDCPVALVGENVLAGSAYLDDEKTGDRAIFCLKAADGTIKWRAEMKFNPWGGPSVAGDLVLVGCSSIRFDADKVKGAMGEVVALNLADGTVKWHKDAGAGVLSPVTIAGELAIFTTTDGKVHAFDLKTGDSKWVYPSKAPFFAGVAVAGDMLYAADLNGVVHAIGLADGKPRWKLDVGKETKSPGNIYGSPVLDGGRLYVGTCNIGAQAAAKNVIVCIGEK
jgi:outer membrane protein assembly factor BamB